MAGGRVPNMCLAEENYISDEGTLSRTRTWAPVTVGVQDQETLETELRIFAAETAAFAARFIKDANVRVEYLSQSKAFAEGMIKEVSDGSLTAREAARRTHSMRNALLETQRLKSSDIGRAIAESIKKTGVSLTDLQEKYAQKRFGKAFGQLLDSQKSEVYLDVVEASGRPNAKFSRTASRIGKLGKGLAVLSIGIVVYDVYTAEDKPKAAVSGGASIGGGFLGGAAGGAAAGLVCGPGAPICSGVVKHIGVKSCNATFSDQRYHLAVFQVVW